MRGVWVPLIHSSTPRPQLSASRLQLTMDHDHTIPIYQTTNLKYPLDRFPSSLGRGRSTHESYFFHARHRPSYPRSPPTLQASARPCLNFREGHVLEVTRLQGQPLSNGHQQSITPDCKGSVLQITVTNKQGSLGSAVGVQILFG